MIREVERKATSGLFMVFVLLVLTALTAFGFISAARAQDGLKIAVFATAFVVIMVAWAGLFTVQPNEAKALQFFGEYAGTVRAPGLWWMNPFYTKKGISLRVRNFETPKLKVNDHASNPIEIAAVVVWRVEDTAKAMFDVNDFEEYVNIQSESAVRHLCSQYAYDHGEAHEVTLRSGVDEVSHALEDELRQRLAPAGVAIEEARLTHLAYAPEVAQAMLRRQQAEAVLAARSKIVQGAVSMVEMALNDLASRNVVELDPERKAAMVSNLMIVLCGDSEAKPVINTGTLYG